MKSGIITLMLLAVMGMRGSAQDIPDIERLLEGNDILVTEEGYEEMINTLVYLKAFPLDINTAGFDSLKMLFLLSDSQIDQIIRFRERYGNFLHLNELMLVPGIGQKDFDNIQPFVTVGQPHFRDRISAIRRHTRHELLARMRMSYPLQEGYTFYSPYDFDKRKEYERKADSRFHGPPFGTLLKYKVRTGNHLQAGITLENDAGEGYFTRHQRAGFDFLSAHVSVTTPRFFRRIILGDYRVQWGQGLVAWGGFTSGKSNVTVGNEKSGRGVQPYASTDENNFLRGIALSLQPCRNLTADVFFSKKKTDGRVTQADTLSDEDLLSVSLYESGYHRNNTECLKKDVLKEITTGISLQWNTPAFKAGLNALYYDFTPSLIRGDRLYQWYNDTGEKRFLMSVDYKTAFRGIYIFGETAWCERNVWATIDGVRWSNSFLSASVLYRRYDRQYVSRYAAGFGEFSNTSNEEGVYIGMDWTPVKNLKVNVYYDWFRFFSPRYRALTPGRGWELLGEITYSHRQWEQIFHVKHEIRPEDQKAKGTIERGKSEYRYQVNYTCSRQVELRSRLSLSRYHKDVVRELGYMAYQDVIYALPHRNLKMQCRLAWFKTDSYQSRIYAYENNVLYGYSFPMFMGEGWRTYLNLSWKPVKKLTCYLKAGFIIYPGQESISSGITEIEDNKLYDLTFQLRLSL